MFVNTSTTAFVCFRSSHAQGDEIQQDRRVLVSITNLDREYPLRSLRCEHIGSLLAISGTITRTTDVKPELLFGSFTCDKCHTEIKSVDQAFHFTKPAMCPNPDCNNRSQFTFNMNESLFDDWQRAKLQENTSEIPAGSMPRSLDLILRNSLVERVKPGDQIVATGTLIVVPDAFAYAPRETVISRGRQAQGVSLGSAGTAGEGVAGLLGQGVKLLTYKTAFLCSSVRVEGGETPVTAEFSDVMKQTIMAMREANIIYNKLAESIAPTIYGHVGADSRGNRVERRETRDSAAVGGWSSEENRGRDVDPRGSEHLHRGRPVDGEVAVPEVRGVGGAARAVHVGKVRVGGRADGGRDAGRGDAGGVSGGGRADAER